MRKKIIKIYVVVLFVEILIFNNCYAASITNEVFIQKFKECIQGEFRANIDNSKIELLHLSSDDEYCTIYYDLSDKPTFKIPMEFNNNMSFDEFSDENAKYMYFVYCLKALRDYLENDIGEYAGIYFGNATIDLLSDEEDTTRENYNKEIVISNVKNTFTDKHIEDDVFTLNFVTIKDNSSNFEVEAILKPKLTENTNKINEEKSLEKEKQKDKVEKNKNTAKTNSKEDNTIVNMNKFPNTGTQFEFLHLLEIIVVLVIVSIIIVVIQEKKNNK